MCFLGARANLRAIGVFGEPKPLMPHRRVAIKVSRGFLRGVGGFSLGMFLLLFLSFDGFLGIFRALGLLGGSCHDRG